MINNKNFKIDNIFKIKKRKGGHYDEKIYFVLCFGSRVTASA